MCRKRIFRMVALLIAAVMLLGALPIFAGDGWSTYTTLSDGAANTSSFAFDGNWVADASTGDMYATTAGSTMTFAFNGTGFSVDAFVNVQGGVSLNNDQITLTIDGAPAEALNMHAGETGGYSVGNNQVFIKTGLSQGKHTVVITVGARDGFVGFYPASVGVLGKMMAPPAWIEYKAEAEDAPNTVNFKFSQNWRNKIVPGYMECWLADETVSFAFTGTAMQVLAFVNTQDVTGDGILDSCNNNNVYISIDGKAKQPLSIVAESYTVENRVVYEVSGLTDTTHTVEIICGNYTSPAISNSFYFYGVKVYNGQMVTPPVWTQYLADNNGKANTEAFAFSENWRNNINPGKQECWLAGESVEFSFNGTGARILAEVNTQDITGDGVLDSCCNNQVSISIDGAPAHPLAMVAQTVTYGNLPVYQIAGLEDGTHTAKIVCGDYTAPALSNSFYFYGVEILNGTMGTPPVWTEYKADLDGVANTAAFTFNGNWRNTISAGKQECWLAGDNVEFSFTGTGLKVLAEVNTQDVNGDGVLDSCSNNNVYISIDGGASQPLSILAQTTVYGNLPVYQIVGLDAGTHTAVITCGNYTTPAISNSFYLYSVQILNGSMGTPPVWTEYKADLDGVANTVYYKFSANWRNTISPGKQECWLDGENVEFSFNGTGLKVLAEVNTQDVNSDGALESCSNNNVYISIDGGENQQLSIVADMMTYGNLPVYQIAGLENGEHTAVITCGSYTEPAISNSFYLYSVQILGGSMNEQPVWSDTYYAVDRNLVATPYYSYTGTTWNTFVSGDIKLMHSGAAGESMDFAFSGTGVRLFVSVNVQNGVSLNNDNITISVDGGETVLANMRINAAPGAVANVYEITGLGKGYHTVTVNNNARVSEYGSQFFYYGAQIADGTMEDPPVWSDIIRALSDKFVQNPDFTYAGTGAWLPYTDNTCMRSVTANDTVSFSFDGTGIKIFANVNVQNGEALNNDCVAVSIDDGAPVSMDMRKDNLSGVNTVVYSVDGLNPGTHRVVITNQERNDPHGTEFYFYGISVLNGDISDIRGTIENLSVHTMPSALYYGDHTEIDLSGLVLKANQDDNYLIEPKNNTVEIVSGATENNGKYYVSVGTPNRVQTVTCAYKGHAFDLPLIYYSVDSVEVTTLPKTEYTPNDDHYITSGGQISITLGDSGIFEKPIATELLTVEMITDNYNTALSCGQTKDVSCSYLGKNFSYKITMVNIAGDLDGDKDVDENDLVLLIRHLLGDPDAVLSEYAFAAAELDGYSGITMEDATVLKICLDQLITPRLPQTMVSPVATPTAQELSPDTQSVIALTARNVRHIGRTYYNEEANGYNFNWSCSGFEFRFNGTKAEMQLTGATIFADNGTYPLVQVFVDGAQEPTQVIQLSDTAKWYTLAENLSDSVHVIKVLKQNQTAYSSAVATGIRLQGTLLAPLTYEGFGVQIIGDSIAAGMFNETEGLSENEYVLAEENSYLTEYAILARSMGADFSIFANSGAAVNVSSGPVRKDVQVGRTVTDLYQFTDLFWGYEGTNKRDNIRTDVIVINLGTNDLGYMGSSPERQQAFTQAYVELLRYLRVRYPDALIVCTAGVIEIAPIDLVREAVAVVNTEDGDLNTYAFHEAQLTHSGHPRVADNYALAQTLQSFIESKLN